jgi:O-antigen/teichoic acid export membrane protein
MDKPTESPLGIPHAVHRKPLARRLLEAIAGQALGRALSALLTLATTSLVVRSLARGDYGHMSAGLAFGALFASLNDPGLNQIVLRRAPRPGTEQDELVGQAVGLSVAVSAATAIVAAAVAYAVLSPAGDVAWQAGLLGCAALLPSGIAAAYYPLFQSRLKLWPIAGSDVVLRIVTLLALLWILSAGGGPVAVAAVVSGASLVALAVIVSQVEARRVRIGFDRAIWGPLLREAAPAGIGLVAYGVYVKVDVIVMARLGTAGSLANYAISYRASDMVMGVIFALLIATVGPLTESALGDLEQLANRLARVRRGMIALGFCVAVGGTALAPLIVRILAGSHGYGGAVRPMSILLIATSCTALWSAYNVVLVALGRGTVLIPMTVGVLGLNVAANIAAIPTLGATGAALVTFCTELLSMLIAARFLKGSLRLPPLRPTERAMVWCGVITCGAILLLR